MKNILLQLTDAAILEQNMLITGPAGIGKLCRIKNLLDTNGVPYSHEYDAENTRDILDMGRFKWTLKVGGPLLAVAN